MCVLVCFCVCVNGVLKCTRLLFVPCAWSMNYVLPRLLANPQGFQEVTNSYFLWPEPISSPQMPISLSKSRQHLNGIDECMFQNVTSHPLHCGISSEHCFKEEEKNTQKKILSPSFYPLPLSDHTNTSCISLTTQPLLSITVSHLWMLDKNKTVNSYMGQNTHKLTK